MYIDYQLIPTYLNLGSWLLLLAICIPCLRHAPWRELQAVPARQHLLFAGALTCLLLWLMSVRTIEGLWLHFFGITTFTLVVGLRLVLLAGLLTSAAYALLVQYSLSGMALSWLYSVALPAALTRALTNLLRHYCPRNLFVYLLGAGFGGGVLTPIVVSLAALPLFELMGRSDWVQGALNNWVLVVLVAFPEGFTNGALIATLAVLSPSLLRTFDEDHYLGPPPGE